MESKQIARILFNLSLDMDYLDAKETASEEIEILTADIERIKETALFHLLENIAYQTGDDTPLLDELLR